MRQIELILENDAEQPPDYDCLAFKVDHLYDILVYCETIINIPLIVYELLNNSIIILESFYEDVNDSYCAPLVKTGLLGRPAYHITK